jgi:tetratricopeptide (TPR) repeat protein
MRRVRLIVLAALMAAIPRPAACQPRILLASGTDSTSAAALARADRAFAAQRWREAAELYQDGLGAGGGAPQRWSALGHALFNEHRHRESIAAYERALQLGAAEPATAAWQIARAYALTGNRKQALRWLGHAADMGLDARQAILREPAFDEYRDDPRLSALWDAPRSSRRSPPRFPASRARHAPVREIERAQLAAAHPLHPRDEAVRAGAPVDDALRKVVGEVLEPHLVARGADGAELGRRLAGGLRREDQGVAGGGDARLLVLDD